MEPACSAPALAARRTAPERSRRQRRGRFCAASSGENLGVSRRLRELELKLWTTRSTLRHLIVELH